MCFSSFLTAFSSLDLAYFLTSVFSSFLTAFLLSWCLWDFLSFFYSDSFGSSFLGSSFGFGDSFGFSSLGFSSSFGLFSFGFSSFLDFSSLGFSSFSFSSLGFCFSDSSLVDSFFWCFSSFGFLISLGFSSFLVSFFCLTWRESLDGFFWERLWWCLSLSLAAAAASASSSSSELSDSDEDDSLEDRFGADFLAGAAFFGAVSFLVGESFTGFGALFWQLVFLVRTF